MDQHWLTVRSVWISPDDMSLKDIRWEIKTSNLNATKINEYVCLAKRRSPFELCSFTTKPISLSENVFIFPIPKKRRINTRTKTERVCVCVNARTINEIPLIQSSRFWSIHLINMPPGSHAYWASERERERLCCADSRCIGHWNLTEKKNTTPHFCISMQ